MPSWVRVVARVSMGHTEGGAVARAPFSAPCLPMWTKGCHSGFLHRGKGGPTGQQSSCLTRGAPFLVGTLFADWLPLMHLFVRGSFPCFLAWTKHCGVCACPMAGGWLGASMVMLLGVPEDSNFGVGPQPPPHAYFIYRYPVVFAHGNLNSRLFEPVWDKTQACHP